MARNFYYGSDARIVSGSANFSVLINQSAASYGVPEDRAEQYAQLDAALQEAYRTAITPHTRTPVAVQIKNERLQEVQREAARLAKIIYATPTVEDGQLTALGLLPRPVRTPQAAPPAPPVIDVLSVVGRIVRIRIRTRAEEGGRKPPSCLGAQLYSFTGPEAPDNARQYHYEGLATRAKAEITFPNEVPSGSTVWISAAWVSRRGTSSIGCDPIRVTLQGGPVCASAA